MLASARIGSFMLKEYERRRGRRRYKAFSDGLSGDTTFRSCGQVRYQKCSGRQDHA